METLPRWPMDGEPGSAMPLPRPQVRKAEIFFLTSARHGWQILRLSVSPYDSSLTSREQEEQAIFRQVVHLTRLCLSSSNLQLQLKQMRTESGTRTSRPSTTMTLPRRRSGLSLVPGSESDRSRDGDRAPESTTWPPDEDRPRGALSAFASANGMRSKPARFKREERERKKKTWLTDRAALDQTRGADQEVFLPDRLGFGKLATSAAGAVVAGGGGGGGRSAGVAAGNGLPCAAGGGGGGDDAGLALGAAAGGGAGGGAVTSAPIPMRQRTDLAGSSTMQAPLSQV